MSFEEWFDEFNGGWVDHGRRQQQFAFDVVLELAQEIRKFNDVVFKLNYLVRFYYSHFDVLWLHFVQWII